jgi:type II secretory pathway component PulC
VRVVEKSTAPRTRKRVGAVFLLVALLLTVGGMWVDHFSPFDRWVHNRLYPAPPPAKPLGVRDTSDIHVVQPEPIGTDSSISVSPLPLMLTGTRLGRNAREGYADIGVHALSPQTYRAGAILANGARLEEIYADYVVLVRDTHRARLYVTGRAAPADAPKPYMPLLVVGGPSRLEATAVADSRDRLTEVIRASPVYEGDTFRALEVYGSGQSDAFFRLGFEPGDRVTAIEGVALKNSDDAFAQLRRLTEGDTLTVTVERGGKAQTLALDGSILVGGSPRG